LILLGTEDGKCGKDRATINDFIVERVEPLIEN
jgi:hypothetical protein